MAQIVRSRPNLKREVEPLYRLTRAARILGIGPKTLYSWIGVSKVRCTHIGSGVIRIPLSELNRVAEGLRLTRRK